MHATARRAGRETLHLLTDLAVGIAGFTIVLTGLATGAGLLITFVGLPVLTATVLVARGAGRLELVRARRLLGVDLPPPRRLPRGGTPIARLLAPLRDGAAWRAAAYFLLMLPVGIVTFTVALTWWAVALGLLTLPTWAWSLPHGGPQLADGRYLNRPWQLATAFAVGIGLTLAAPAVVHALTYLDRALLQLLRRSHSDEQIETLRRTRARSTAGDPLGLLEAAERERPDLAIVDVRMPPTFTDEGVRAALELRERLPEIAVLVLSQYVEEEYAGELLARNARGVGYLLEESVTDTRAFLDAAERVAVGGTAIDAEVVAQLLARAARADPLDRLTGREREVLALMAEGLSNASIAERLVVTEGAVEKHVRSIFQKLRLPAADGTHRRVLAVLRFLEAARP
jgi:DNA-binding NarL/FixJ family response regulator